MTWSSGRSVSSNYGAEYDPGLRMRGLLDGANGLLHLTACRFIASAGDVDDNARGP